MAGLLLSTCLKSEIGIMLDFIVCSQPTLVKVVTGENECNN